jgi:hypothetical protein
MITLRPANLFQRVATRASFRLLQFMRRTDRLGVRQIFNPLLREPVAAFVQWIMNLTRRNENFQLAEERTLPNEEAATDSIIEAFGTYMRQHYRPGEYERGGNTKTHGIVRAEFIIHDNLPPEFRHGVFAQPKTYKAWVRFAGPGPDMPKDIDDVGFVSCSIKVIGVESKKLMEDEKTTQDFIMVSTPTFVTPEIASNALLQAYVLRGTPIFYFLTTGIQHFLDFIMQGLWNETQTSTLEARYWSCVPYLLGEGQAMMYSVRPRIPKRSRIPGYPCRTSPIYLRNSMIEALGKGPVDFDFMVQRQTDAFRMPIENAGVRWPEKLSPFVTVATLRMPQQVFDSQAQFDFGRNLSYTPWHCIAEHRPLGNQSRARRRMYFELRRLRQTMNATPHIEPTGNEVFPGDPKARPIPDPLLPPYMASALGSRMPLRVDGDAAARRAAAKVSGEQEP